MAWAEQIPGSGRWRGLYRDHSGHKHTAPGGPFGTRAEALRRAGSEEDGARQQPGRIAPTAGRATWATWVEHWWPRRKVEPGTQARDLSRRVTHLDVRWGPVRLDAIKRDDVQDWVDNLYASGMAPSTVANCYHLLSASMKAAVLAGRIAATPCVSVELPVRPPPDERYLTWDEVTAIAHFLDERDALLVWMLVGTGTRWGEAVGAHRHRLHLAERRLDVHETWDQRSREVKPYPKGRQKRSVPLPAWMVEKLTAHVGELQAATSCGATHRRGSRCRSGLIVPGRGGTAVDYDAFHDRWSRAVGYWSWRTTDGEQSFRSESAGRRKLGPKTLLKRAWQPGLVDVGPVRVHDLRHTYASWLIQDGVSIEALSELLGHSSVLVTQRYAHLASSQWDAVRAVLDARSAPVLPQVDRAVGAEDPNVLPFPTSKP